MATRALTAISNAVTSFTNRMLPTTDVDIEEYTDVVDEIDSESYILYYHITKSNLSVLVLSEIEMTLGCKIKLCQSATDLVKQFSAEKVELVLVDYEIFIDSELCVSEIVNMLVTLFRLINTLSIIKIGIVIANTCPSGFIKEIQQTDISGIVPGDYSYGKPATIKAVSELYDGQSSWPKTLIDLITSKTAKAVVKRSVSIEDQLTVRQQQVLKLVKNRGLSNKAIGSMLKIAESTVKVHIGKLMKLYGVRNRTQLVLATSDKGLRK